MRAADLLERMRANPQADWTIADIERLCRRLDDNSAAPRLALQGARSASGTTLTIPARRPVRPIYIRALVALADRFREGKNG